MAVSQGGKPADLETILEIVYIYFGGDKDKVQSWLRTTNAMLDNRAPMDFIRDGQPERILELIRDMVEGMEDMETKP